MTLLYLYIAAGAATAATVGGTLAVIRLMLDEDGWSARDWLYAAGITAASFVAWPVYVGGIAYNLWKNER